MLKRILSVGICGLFLGGCASRRPPVIVEPSGPAAQDTAAPATPKPEPARSEKPAGPEPAEKSPAADKAVAAEPQIKPRPYHTRDLPSYTYTRLDSAAAGQEPVLSRARLFMEGPSRDTAGYHPDSGGSRIAEGYRIQVYATTNYKEAERKKDDLLSVLDEKVYVVYEFPYYKIRLGNFPEEDDTRTLRRKLVELGHEARVVKTKIRISPTP